MEPGAIQHERLLNSFESIRTGFSELVADISRESSDVEFEGNATN